LSRSQVLHLVIFTYFTRIAFLSTTIDDVTNWVMHKILNANLIKLWCYN